MRSNIIVSMLALTGLSFGIVPDAPGAAVATDPVQEVADKHQSLVSRLKDWIVGELGEVYDEGRELINELGSFFENNSLGTVQDDSGATVVVAVPPVAEDHASTAPTTDGPTTAPVDTSVPQAPTTTGTDVVAEAEPELRDIDTGGKGGDAPGV